MAIAGSSGRMGRMLIEAVEAADDCVLAGALDVAGSPALGTDATAWLGRESGVQVTADVRTALANAQVLI
ncbi:MAG: 4-hydroxy-tetrahydrodipicolinate reductase, partial [Aquincola sp.]|nr:4-hydroxy-tetrahydrodipicolinate reductase [Aquincola sp.]